MNPEDFIIQYSLALRKQEWKVIEPLVSNSVCVSFSNGKVHKGIVEVRKAFEYNFSKIKNEDYLISNVAWLKKESHFAVYIFEFKWSGLIDGNSAQGNGIGTSVIVKEDSVWKLLTEHLGKKY